MPSLKMKSTSDSDICLKQKNSLRVCQKSKKISKTPLSGAKDSQNAEEIGPYNQNSLDVSVEVYREDFEGDGVNNDESSNEVKLIQKQPSSLTDSTTLDSMEPTQSTCTSNIATIFSPILESMGVPQTEGSENLYMKQLDSEDSDSRSRSSCEYQACNVSDFYISDMIFSGPPVETSPVFDNRTDTMFLPDFEYEDSTLLCDLTEEYMLLPFLEDTLDNGHNHDDRPSEETITNSDNSNFYMAIHQLRSYNQEPHINSYPDSDYEFDPQMYIKVLPDQQETAFNGLPPSVPDGKQSTKKISLVLDLDETLVHSTMEHCDHADFTFPVFFNMNEHTVYVKRRPHLQTFLERVAEMFEIVVFTASQSIYAEKLLNILDPSGKLISRRAYRESCIFSEGSYIKDLTVLGVDLAKVAIIDNSPQFKY